MSIRNSEEYSTHLSYNLHNFVSRDNEYFWRWLADKRSSGFHPSYTAFPYQACHFQNNSCKFQISFVSEQKTRVAYIKSHQNCSPHQQHERFHCKPTHFSAELRHDARSYKLWGTRTDHEKGCPHFQLSHHFLHQPKKKERKKGVMLMPKSEYRHRCIISTSTYTHIPVTFIPVSLSTLVCGYPLDDGWLFILKPVQKETDIWKKTNYSIRG